MLIGGDLVRLVLGCLFCAKSGRVRRWGAHPEALTVQSQPRGRLFHGASAGAHNLIERQCLRLATRYDTLAANYLAFVKLAYIRLWLRALCVRGLR